MLLKRTRFLLFLLAPLLLQAQQPGTHLLHTADALGPHESKVVYAVMYDMDVRFVVSLADQMIKVRTPVDVRTEDLIAALAAHGILAFVPPGDTTDPNDTRTMELPPELELPPFTGNVQLDDATMQQAVEQWKRDDPKGYLQWLNSLPGNATPMDE